MELGNLVGLIKISSPQANGPFEPKNVKTRKSASTQFLFPVLALCKSVFRPKRPDFDGIGQFCPYRNIFSPSQRSSRAQKRKIIFKIGRVMSV